MLLNDLKLDDNVEGQNEDFVPGGDFSMPTGAYPMKIEQAFMGESSGGSASLTLHLKEIGGKRTLRETFYLTSRKDANGNRRNTYMDKRTNTPRPLPGMAHADALCQVACGLKLHALTAEEKVVALWNFEERKELPTKVPALTQIIGQDILVCLVRRRENKNTKVGDAYVPTAEERVFNEVQKFLYADGSTVAEKIAGDESRTFKTNWEAKHNADYVLDKYVAVAGAADVAAASTAAAEESKEEVTSLFSTPAAPAADAPAAAPAPEAAAG